VLSGCRVDWKEVAIVCQDGRVIDVHAHCVPSELLPILSADGGRFGIEVLGTDPVRLRIAGQRTTPPLHPALTDLPARLAAMDAMGVARQLVSPFIDLTAYELEATTGGRYSRLFNELLAATADRAPQRLRALATVPLQSGELAARELEHALTKLGMVGVEVGARLPSGHLDDPELAQFWAVAETLGCLVLVHPLSGGTAAVPYFLGNLVGNPAETTMAAARLIFGGVLDRFPSVRVCLVHGGGFLPYQSGRLERGFHAIGHSRGARLETSPRELLGRLYYDTVLHSPAMIRTLIDLVGPEQVLLGSDYPFEMGDPDPVATLAQVPGLSEADRKLIQSANADRLLAGLAASPGP
jgi:aminocarboxymuconate-semialdehyde decarboxylase